MILGIDEAGRGAVMGPLVVAGVLVDDDRNLHPGIKDSKELSPTKRRWFAREIMSKARCSVQTLDAEGIDDWRQSATMNEIEVTIFNGIVSDFFGGVKFEKPGEHTLVVDQVDEHMGDYLRTAWSPLLEVVSAPHADKNYPAVSAASIVAKVWRDMEMMVIERTLGEWTGSGYPGDPKTVLFMNRWLWKGRTLPRKFVRYSWKTTQRMLERHGQP